MKIGRPFGRTPKQKSSKLYDDRMENAGKQPVETPGYEPFASLAGFVACLAGAGVFCVSSGHVAVGIGLFVFAFLPAALVVAQGVQLGKQIASGEVALAPKVAGEAYGPEADRFWAIENKALTKAELDDADEKRAAELAAAESWFEAAQASFDTVDLEAEDGARLVGHALRAQEPSPYWLIYAHGLGGSWKSGAAFARRFAESGYNLLLVNMRAQGESGGALTGYGHLERRDLLAWSSWVARTDAAARIVLAGFSAGGDAVLEAAGEKDVPEQVMAVVADSAYADLWNEAIHVMGRMGANGKALPAHPVLDIARLSFRSRKGGFDLADASAVKAVEHAQVPILVLHGEDDAAVPPFSADRLGEAASGPHEVVKFPGAGHCCASVADPEPYYEAVFSFLANLPA
ncbi:MAG: alpha/beta fold hydrolase [Coriobacteriia bacterium]|nr:alpha/beta fold hydrolase [Coriobacteriia bacterium]